MFWPNINQLIAIRLDNDLETCEFNKLTDCRGNWLRNCWVDTNKLWSELRSVLIGAIASYYLYICSRKRVESRVGLGDRNEKFLFRRFCEDRLKKHFVRVVKGNVHTVHKNCLFQPMRFLITQRKLFPHNSVTLWRSNSSSPARRKQNTYHDLHSLDKALACMTLIRDHLQPLKSYRYRYCN